MASEEFLTQLPLRIVDRLVHLDRSFGDTARAVGEALEGGDGKGAEREGRGGQVGIGGLEETFQTGLMLKRQLDELEKESSIPDRSGHLALLLNSEYVLWSLNAHTPLRLNPFLSHWVEVVRNYEMRNSIVIEEVGTKMNDSSLQSARVEMVKLILAGEIETLSSLAPKQFADRLRLFPPRDLDIAPFIEMLEEEGIWDPESPVPSSRPTPTHSRSSSFQNRETSEPSADSGSNKPPPSESPNADAMPSHEPQARVPKFKSRPTPLTPSTLEHHLQANPIQTLRTLTHLPIDLSSLDLLTTALTSPFLVVIGIEPPSVARDYIQHALRVIEGGVNAPDPNDAPSRAPPQWNEWRDTQPQSVYEDDDDEDDDDEDEEDDGDEYEDDGEASTPRGRTAELHDMGIEIMWERGATPSLPHPSLGVPPSRRSGEDGRAAEGKQAGTAAQAQNRASATEAARAGAIATDPAEDMPTDRASLQRAATLLVLFVRSLIRKGIVEVQDLYWEIQELCVRFLWVKDVRRLKAWVETGEDEEEDTNVEVGGGKEKSKGVDGERERGG
ncbi:hypothetical protein P152DRAFT_499052 [Eremomyces bilateralis CBS 781.70]|uniref:Uncharacterized protein n=1 Tax=Eremomyces bilateralis CBS 781.70 TaxID=1392243 RepID=A0A6G1GB24_9PEZI|nr:uncharacterized protein P152DRAFT_499052 [Eremomyces bilateralis CBS 781.70]KAF1815111.1 hypothetical protein P152DRAFT_499052 [Eremomyces bilateralis CBS 781.70]